MFSELIDSAAIVPQFNWEAIITINMSAILFTYIPPFKEAYKHIKLRIQSFFVLFSDNCFLLNI